MVANTSGFAIRRKLLKHFAAFAETTPRLMASLGALNPAAGQKRRRMAELCLGRLGGDEPHVLTLHKGPILHTNKDKVPEPVQYQIAGSIVHQMP